MRQSSPSIQFMTRLPGGNHGLQKQSHWLAD
jgi:hypothetical protein